MQKPQNYDETKAGGEFTPINLGGHHLVIKQVEETTSKTGKPMLKVFFDFAKNDSQPGYMTEEYKNDIRADKKWPHAGTQYILSEDADGNCSKSFKSFISCFEKSNNCTAVWGDKFAAQFKNKIIGAVFGEVENEYNGKRTMRHELRWFCSDDKVDGAAVPDPKYISGNKPLGAGSGNAGGGATPNVDVPEGTDEELPFG